MEVATIQSNVVVDNWSHWDMTDFETGEKKWYHKVLEFILPTRKKMNIYITKLLILIFFFLTVLGMLMKGAMPGSQVFAVLLLGLLAAIGGKLISFIKLPPLLGMMIVGFLFRNVEAISFYEDIDRKTIMVLREVALAIILMRAGLGIDGQQLKKSKLAVLRLTVVPLIVEALSMGVFAHFLLGLPWMFALMLGFILSAIAPEVILPVILHLESQGYGGSKGIPTILIAACSLDDIGAIAGFTICFSIAFSDDNLIWTIVKAPLEPVVGFAFGAVFGVIFWSFPSERLKKNTLIFYNVLLISFGAMTVLFASTRLGLPGAGPLGCITLAFIAGIKFRQDEVRFKGVQKVTSQIWAIINPFLFAMIGTEVTLDTLQNNAGYGILAIFCALSCRSVATVLVCFGLNLNFKEKIYMVFSWLPKAVVQAAIGSQALDYARIHNLHPELQKYGEIVLNVCVLSILVTAPLSAVLCTVFGPYLLTRDRIPEIEDEYETEDELSETPKPSASVAGIEASSSQPLVTPDSQKH
ncbi:hypothetical protein JTE90_005862 [Oedothorax gibbosus]|uniref:Cation/H+ exchanger transmembrane domain-containing protein n=1 Tax=Oedothorax gibbosus TaxID=931172 RepID=A0AAV6UPE3_9ARAC|nr:hypothetical protein JTE90_005862 [Oedothorax gibbosus]